MKEEIRISDRKKELLFNAVESYIENASPITSEKVHNTLFNNLSSATLRNELNTLEQMGYLKQLHTSSGRVPTTKAYRFYVNQLLSNNNFDENVINEIKDKFVVRSTFLSDVLSDIAKSINEITNFPTYVKIKGYKNLVVQGINVIPLITGQGLVLFQTSAGIINNTVNLSPDVTEEICKDASKYLTTNLYGKTIEDIIENIDYYNNLFKNQIKFYQELFVSVTNVIKKFAEEKTSRLIHNNATKLLDEPEYKDINRAKKFLSIIENEHEIKEIIENIDDNSTSELVFTIGEENLNEKYSDYSIINANYNIGNGVVASVSVLGPERMDYAKIASALKYISDEIKNFHKE